jgi:hypothetical protein
MSMVSWMLAMVRWSVGGPTSTTRLIAIVVVMAGMLGFPSWSPAYAQLEQGQLAADEGRFELALTYLNRAIRSDRLSRAEMLRALERRVLVFYALHREKPLERDLDLLLAIDPAADFGTAAPPDLAAIVAERRQKARPLRISVRVQELPGAVRVQVDDSFVLEGYGIKALVGARSPGGEWQLSFEGQVDLATPGPSIEYFAALVTPRGAVLVSDGSQDAPKLHRIQPALPSSATTRPLDERSDEWTGHRRRALWWTVGGASVAVVVATTLALLLARGAASSGPEIQEPHVEYP